MVELNAGISTRNKGSVCEKQQAHVWRTLLLNSNDYIIGRCGMLSMWSQVILLTADPCYVKIEEDVNKSG